MTRLFVWLSPVAADIVLNQETTIQAARRFC